MAKRNTSIKNKRYKPPKSRRRNVRAGNGWVVFKLVVTVVLVLAFLAGLVYLVLPNVLAMMGVEFYPPGMSAPTPEPTPAPTPTPYPLTTDDLAELHHEIVVAQTDYRWFGDPYYYDGKILFTGGEVVNGATHMTTLFIHDTATETLEPLNVTPANTHLMYPVMNASYLAYLDANMSGGGTITAWQIDETGALISPRTVKTVYTGQPQLFLWDKYLAWTERTGSYMDKLFLCDLETLETVTVRMCDKAYSGTSLPSLADGLLVWSDVDTEDATGKVNSRIYAMDVATGELTDYAIGMYAHDPKTDGHRIAWMDGNHGPETSLYLSDFDAMDAAPTLIAEGVIDFFIGDKFLAYSKDETVYVYSYAQGRSFELTGKNQLAQLLYANGEAVMWMDVTSRARDVVKYAIVPE